MAHNCSTRMITVVFGSQIENSIRRVYEHTVCTGQMFDIQGHFASFLNAADVHIICSHLEENLACWTYQGGTCWLQKITFLSAPEIIYSWSLIYWSATSYSDLNFPLSFLPVWICMCHQTYLFHICSFWYFFKHLLCSLWKEVNDLIKMLTDIFF